MIVIPPHSLGTFFKNLVHLIEIALHITYQNPILENQKNRKHLVHEGIKQGCLQWYSDVMNPLKLTFCPLETIFLSYSDFHLASQVH